MASQHHQGHYHQQQGQYQPAQGVSRMASNASSYYGAPNSSARPATQHAAQGGPSSGRQPSTVRRVIPPCPAGVSESHWKWFHTVDVDASGQISPLELQQALINGDHSKFESETIKMLFGLFDTDKSGSIGFTECVALLLSTLQRAAVGQTDAMALPRPPPPCTTNALARFVAVFKYVEQWQSIFRTFDVDRSGTIEAPELASALQQFRERCFQSSQGAPRPSTELLRAKKHSATLTFTEYNLSPRLIDLLCKKFSPLPSGPSMSEPGITFGAHCLNRECIPRRQCTKR